MFQPAPGCVEIEPIKEEGILIDPNQRYDEIGLVIAVADNTFDIEVGDTIFFDAYACRATPEIAGKKHYIVQVNDGGLLGISKHVETEPL